MGGSYTDQGHVGVLLLRVELRMEEAKGLKSICLAPNVLSSWLLFKPLDFKKWFFVAAWAGFAMILKEKLF